MTHKRVEYWSLRGHDFKRIKGSLTILGQELFEKIKQLGFTKYESSADYLGFTIIKDHDRLLTSVGVNLNREDPIEYVIEMMVYDKDKQDGETIILYQFDSLEKLRSQIVDDYKQLEERLLGEGSKSKGSKARP